MSKNTILPVLFLAAVTVCQAQLAITEAMPSASTNLGTTLRYNAIPPMVQHPRAADYFTRKANFYERTSFFHCPSAKFPNNAPAALYPLFSMSMNSKLIEAPAITMGIAGVIRPSDTVIFLENRLAPEPLVDPAQPTTELGQPSSYASRFVARHAKSGNLVFLDGHAESVRGNQVVESATGPNRGKAIVPQTRIVWTADPAANPNL